MKRDSTLPPSLNEKAKNLEKETLVKNIYFFWLYTENKWGEFEENDLKRLTQIVAREVGITPEQAKKIIVCFGDNFQLNTTEDSYFNAGACVNRYTPDGTHLHSLIVFDRASTFPRYGKAVNNFDYRPENRIFLRSNLEFILWLLIEELNHAKIAMMDGTSQETDKRQSKYQQVIERRQKQIQGSHDESLHEMVAIRAVLRILIKLLQPIDSERAQYFQSFYERLKQSNEHMAPSLTEIPPLSTVNWKDKGLNIFQKYKLRKIAGEP